MKNLRHLVWSVGLVACSRARAAPLAFSPATPSGCAVGEGTTEGHRWSTVDLRTAALDDREREVTNARVCGVLSTRFEQSWLRALMDTR